MPSKCDSNCVTLAIDGKMYHRVCCGRPLMSASLDKINGIGWRVEDNLVGSWNSVRWPVALLVEHDLSKGETLWLIWVTGVAYILGLYVLK